MTYREHDPILRPDLHPEWREQAACATVDSDLFFPHDGTGVRVAQAICAGCPVKGACLAYALDAGERFGIWGGVSEKQRWNMMRQRRRGAA